jgi:hypothetical protein
MMNSPMKANAGQVVEASQKPIIIRVFSKNGGWTTEQTEEITLRLDSLDLPLVFRTKETGSIFIAEGDRVEVASMERPDHLALYGLRNVTDGSTYLVRPAKIASARIELSVVVAGLLLTGLVIGAMTMMKLGTDGLLKVYGQFAGVAFGLLLLSAFLRSVFGWIAFPEIRKLVQPGGRREVNAAKRALGLASGNRMVNWI